MIARARRAFPGMVVSMLLAGPAFAGTQAVTDTPAHSRKAPHPVVVQKKSGRTTAAARDQKAGRVDQARVTFVEDTSVWNDSPAGGRGPVRGAQAYANQSPFGTQVPYAAQAPYPAQARGAWKQTGTASWYGGARWAGHMTASGVRYNENELTAAHAWLPIGTRVVVALNGSGRSVVVTINDRPGTHKRIIDLSREAARQLGIMGQGVASVTLSPL